MNKKSVSPLFDITIKNNIFFLENLKTAVFNDDHPRIDKMVKGMKKELQMRKNKRKVKKDKI